MEDDAVWSWYEIRSRRRNATLRLQTIPQWKTTFNAVWNGAWGGGMHDNAWGSRPITKPSFSVKA